MSLVTGKHICIYVKMGLVISKHMTTLVISRCRRKTLENIKRRTSYDQQKLKCQANGSLTCHPNLYPLNAAKSKWIWKGIELGQACCASSVSVSVCVCVCVCVCMHVCLYVSMCAMEWCHCEWVSIIIICEDNIIVAVLLLVRLVMTVSTWRAFSPPPLLYVLGWIAGTAEAP